MLDTGNLKKLLAAAAEGDWEKAESLLLELSKTLWDDPRYTKDESGVFSDLREDERAKDEPFLQPIREAIRLRDEDALYEAVDESLEEIERRLREDAASERFEKYGVPTEEPTGSLLQTTSRLDEIASRVDDITSHLKAIDDQMGDIQRQIPSEYEIQSALEENRTRMPIELISEIQSYAQGTALGVWIIVAFIVYMVAC